MRIWIGSESHTHWVLFSVICWNLDCDIFTLITIIYILYVIENYKLLYNFESIQLYRVSNIRKENAINILTIFPEDIQLLYFVANVVCSFFSYSRFLLLLFFCASFTFLFFIISSICIIYYQMKEEIYLNLWEIAERHHISIMC